MIIRRLNKSDAAEHEKLASLAFIFRAEPETAELPCEYMLGAFDGEKLIADMEIEKRYNNYGGDVLSCLAVGGVASRPETRNRGAVRALFEELFIRSDEDISILYPFSETYYRKFGYEPAGFGIEVTAPFSALSAVEKSRGAELFEGENPVEMLCFYNKCAKSYELSFTRTDLLSFECEPYKNTAYTYIWRNPDSTAKAYATFSADRNASVISVKELSFLDKEGLLGILGFLRAYEGNFKTVRFEKLPLGSPVLNFLNDKCEIKLSSLGAVRVLDVMSVLKKHEYPKGNGSFTLQCKDTIEKNNAVFSVEYSDGEAKIEKAEADADIILEPCAFSKILLCGATASELEYMNGVKICGNIEPFLKAFPKKTVFFNDSF